MTFQMHGTRSSDTPRTAIPNMTKAESSKVTQQIRGASMHACIMQCIHSPESTQNIQLLIPNSEPSTTITTHRQQIQQYVFFTIIR